jgi:hypothetical protein
MEVEFWSTSFAPPKPSNTNLDVELLSYLPTNATDYTKIKFHLVLFDHQRPFLPPLDVSAPREISPPARP